MAYEEMVVPSTTEEEDTSAWAQVADRPSDPEVEDPFEEAVAEYPALNLEDLGSIVDDYHAARTRMGTVNTPATNDMQAAVGEFMAYVYDIMAEWVEGQSTGGG